MTAPRAEPEDDRDPRRRHYRVERALADRIRDASPGERRGLYGRLYDELFRAVPDHPQLRRRTDPGGAALGWKLALLRPYISPATRFLEIGAGDARLSLELAGRVASVTAIDVSDIVLDRQVPPGNFSLLLTDGVSVPVPPGSVDLAFSNQLMEHLHPDDACEQITSIREALAPGGLYVCVTPNRLSGPHDVSRDYSDVASGLHLKEYTHRELSRLFTRAGFLEPRSFMWGRGMLGRAVPLPPAAIASLERLLEAAPAPIRRAVCRRPPLRGLLGIIMTARRP